MTGADVARAALGLALAASLALTFANRELLSEQKLRDGLAQAGWWTPLAFVALYALARGLVVVTSNVGEFQRIGGLQVKDWR